MTSPEKEFNLGMAASDRSHKGGNLGSPGGAAPLPKSFSKLSKSTTKDKEMTLFTIFSNLFGGQMSSQSVAFTNQFEVYSGKDEEFKAALTKFFGDKSAIYSGMDLNSLIKSIQAKLLQGFLGKDDMLVVSSDGIDLETADRVGKLLNKQMSTEHFVEELAKTVKDGLIHGIGYMSLGWEVTTKMLPKRELRVKSNHEAYVEDFEVSEEEIEMEEIIVETPDFKAENVSNIYMPSAQRWKDLPYVVRKEYVSRKVLNERYGTKVDELIREDAFSSYRTQYEIDREYFPGSESRPGATANELLEVLHFYFRDETYYVCLLSSVETSPKTTSFTGLKLIYEGRSPVPGLAIPIIPFIPEPLTGRIIGESLINLAQGEQRKITELDNLMMRMVRNQASAPFFVGAEAGFDMDAYLNRTPNMPIEVQDVTQIQRAEFDKLDSAIPNLKEHYYSVLQRITGQSDFAMGNIGKSARLTGVDSLIGMAMSRMSIMASQLNRFILDIADALLLLNRAFLPLAYGKQNTSFNAHLPEFKLELPYPLNVKIGTSISGQADKSVILGGLSQLMNMAFQLEASKPGTFDLNAIMIRYFSELGIKDVTRYIKKAPLTVEEASLLHSLDSLAAMQNVSSLAGVPTQMSANTMGATLPMPGMEGQEGSLAMGADMGSNNGGIDTTGQSISQAPINEMTGI